MNGRDGTTAFLPLDSRIGGQGGNGRPGVGQFLTREQTRYMYRKGRDMGNNKHRNNGTRNGTRRTTE